ncbi:MAG: hypothetical protein AAF572_01765 [Cyanobacteria bacterium P01_B01_bin.77]
METTQRTTIQLLIQAATGAAVGLLAGIAIIFLYQWIWHVEISLKTIMVLSVGLFVFCGGLSVWQKQRFWPLLGISLLYIVIEMGTLAMTIP